MKRAFLTITLIAFASCFLQGQQLQLPFFNDTLLVNYDTGILLLPKTKIKDRKAVKLHEQYSRLPFESLLSSLQAHKKRLLLNDWFFYVLVKETVNQLYPETTQTQKDAIVWHCLFKSGYDVLFYTSHKKLYLYGAFAYRKKPPYTCFDYLRSKGRLYGVLNHPLSTNTKPKELGKPGQIAQQKGKLFSFSMDTFPSMKSVSVVKQFHFYIDGKIETIEVEIDKTLMDMLAKMPSNCLSDNFETPLSPMAYNSLIPQLRDLIEGKDTTIAARILLAFVRESFTYQTDSLHFGWEKQMTPEEALYYRHSDCEDRSSLYYYLVKELLDIPIAVLYYRKPPHCSIAVGGINIDDYKPMFKKDSTQFWLAEPTDVSNSLDIGLVPDMLKGKGYKVVKMDLPKHVDVDTVGVAIP